MRVDEICWKYQGLFVAQEEGGTVELIDECHHGGERIHRTAQCRHWLLII
jgi:hypothetical protein